MVWLLLSAVVAFFLPFELFLFAYAVMGPLHYLTEMAWLHERAYFLPGRRDALPLAALGIGISLAAWLGHWLGGWYGRFSFLALGLAGIMVFLRKTDHRLIGVGILLLALVLLERTQLFYLLFTVFLSNIIHVFVFTAAFMLFGALKNRSVSGYTSVALFAGLAVLLVTVGHAPEPVATHQYIHEAYRGFAEMHRQLLILAGHPLPPTETGATMGAIFSSPAGWIAMRFVAFSYTYHYLNWFSKTSVIGWHRIPKRRMAAVVMLWLASLGLYLWDYNLGLRCLLLLSVLHVVLEFPLNLYSFQGIALELRRRFGQAKLRASNAAIRKA